MSERSSEHATFVLERTYPTAPAKVFAAWATAEAKRAWCGPPRGTIGLLEQLAGAVGG